MLQGQAEQTGQGSIIRAVLFKINVAEGQRAVNTGQMLLFEKIGVLPFHCRCGASVLNRPEQVKKAARCFDVRQKESQVQIAQLVKPNAGNALLAHHKTVAVAGKADSDQLAAVCDAKDLKRPGLVYFGYQGTKIFSQFIGWKGQHLISNL